METKQPEWLDVIEGQWAVRIAGRYPVYIVYGDGNVLGVGGGPEGLDRIIGQCFDALARTRLQNGGRIPKDCTRWMRSRPPMVSVVRVDGRKRGPHAVKRYVVALGVDRQLRLVGAAGGS